MSWIADFRCMKCHQGITAYADRVVQRRNIQVQEVLKSSDRQLGGANAIVLDLPKTKIKYQGIVLPEQAVCPAISQQQT